MASFFSLLAIARICASWLNRSVDIGVVRCPSAFASLGCSILDEENVASSAFRGTANESEP